MENEPSISLGGTIVLLTLFAQNLIFVFLYQKYAPVYGKAIKEI